MKAGYIVSLNLCFFLPASVMIFALLASLGWAPFYGINDFPTSRYFDELLTEAGWVPGLIFSLSYSILVSILDISIAFIFAYFFQSITNGFSEGSYRITLFLPYVVASGIFLFMLAPGGFIARLLHALLMIDEANDFPRIFQTEFSPGMALAFLWKQVPFCFLLIVTEINRVSSSVLSSASILGGGFLNSSRFVYLPSLKRLISFLLVLLFLFNFGNYEIPLVLGNTTQDSFSVAVIRLFGQADPNIKLVAISAMTFGFAISILTSIILLLLWNKIYSRLVRFPSFQ